MALFAIEEWWGFGGPHPRLIMIGYIAMAALSIPIWVRIAKRFRSEGDEAAAQIKGTMQRELKQITSEAYRQAEEIRGLADAEAADIYAAAYNRDPDFYRFYQTLQLYREAFDENMLLLMTTGSDFLKYIKKVK